MGLIKFLGYVQAGFPSPASDYMEESIDLNKELIRRPSSTYFFRAQNDSMIDANIPPNSILIVDKAVKPKTNSIVIAVLNGEFTVKFFIQNKDGCMLLPANKKYKPIKILDGMDFSVWGVVTAVIIQTTKHPV
jgi:DNA polymerase V